MSWRSGSLQFKLFGTPSALSVAQRHCTILVVIIAVRNLLDHLGDVCIIIIVMSRIFSVLVSERGTCAVVPKVELCTAQRGRAPMTSFPAVRGSSLEAVV